jgi:hypothetical protein
VVLLKVTSVTEYVAPMVVLYTSVQRRIKMLDNCGIPCLRPSQVDVAEDPAQQVVEIMGNAAGQNPQRIELGRPSAEQAQVVNRFCGGRSLS